MAKAHRSKYLVLLADDSEDDGLLLELAFGRLDRLHLLARMGDGEQTIAYLNGDGKYADRRKYPFPDLLLLDLKMPRMDGFQVLEWLQAHPFPELVVSVLSGSDSTADASQALEMGAHLFQTKELGNHRQLASLKALQRHLVRNKFLTERAPMV
jgi:CheY-like chemotaxis protein